MLSTTQKTTKSILVTECDSWRGFYVAAALLHLTRPHSPFSAPNVSVIAAVSNPSNAYARELALLGAHLRTYDLQSDTNDLLVDVDVLVLIPPPTPHLQLAHTLALSMMRAAETSEKCMRVVLWSSTAAAAAAAHSDALLHALQETERLVLDADGVAIRIVVRSGFLFQYLFGFAPLVHDWDQMPFVSHNKVFAPVDAKDVAMVLAKLALADVEDTDWLRQYNGHAVTVMGTKQVSGSDLVETMNATLGGAGGPDVMLEQVDLDTMQHTLQESGVLDGVDVQLAIRLLRLLAYDKLAHLDVSSSRTLDLVQVLGKQPMQLQDFFDANSAAFRRSTRVAVKGTHKPLGPGGKVEGGGIPLTEDEAKLVYHD